MESGVFESGEVSENRESFDVSAYAESGDYETVESVRLFIDFPLQQTKASKTIVWKNLWIINNLINISM